MACGNYWELSMQKPLDVLIRQLTRTIQNTHNKHTSFQHTHAHTSTHIQVQGPRQMADPTCRHSYLWQHFLCGLLATCLHFTNSGKTKGIPYKCKCSQAAAINAYFTMHKYCVTAVDYGVPFYNRTISFSRACQSLEKLIYI